jgi:hypothetical protein
VCSWAGTCEHNRVRYKCVACHGAGICEHNRVRYVCVACHGAGICEHNRVRYVCCECRLIQEQRLAGEEAIEIEMSMFDTQDSTAAELQRLLDNITL